MVKNTQYFILSAVMVFLLLCSGKVFSAPVVVADLTTYDAGQIPEGKELSHEFVLKNTGDQLLIFKIKPC